MIASIPRLQSAFNFFLNRVLKYLDCSALSIELLYIATVLDSDLET